MGELVETGLGWYLDEDYLLTVGNQQLCTIATGGGGGGGGEPLSPNTQYTDTDLGRTVVFGFGDGNPVWIEISNVTSRVYWMFINMYSQYSSDTIWAVAAVSKNPFSMSMARWEGNPYSATKPPSSPSPIYTETLRGFSLWDDVYGIVIGLHGTASSGSYNYEPNSWTGDIPKLFHESVSGTTVIDTGLGWYADPTYLMWNAGVLAVGQEGSAPVRTYEKSYDGVCLAARFTSFEWAGRHYQGPITISTVEQNAMGDVAPSWTTPAISSSFSYLGATWYYFAEYGIVSEATMSSPLPTISQNYSSMVDIAKAVIDAASVTFSPTVTTKVATKVQGGAGAFAVASYPHDGNTVHVAVGISSIGNPNSAATVALDGTNGNYNTFNREGMQFTMYYTSQETGTLTADVPVVILDTDISSLPGLYEARLFLAVADAAQVHVGYVPADEDPYAGGGTSEPGGGGGSFDGTSDQIDDSTTPTFSFAGSGFCRIYNPSLGELQDLANYLWTDTTFLQTIVNHAKQLLEDPIEAIISLAMLPVAIPQGTSETVKVLFINTRVSMAPATTQYVEVDCGTYALEEYYGSALDYNPYTQVDLFLPFIGQVSLNTDEVMGHTIGVKYRVDIVSGLCVAKVFVDNDCMYQFSGNCAIFMPLNSADFSSYLSAAMTAATALVSAGAGMAAGAAAAGAEAVAEPAVQTGGNLLTSGESLVTPQMALQYRAEESVRPMYSPSVSEGSPSASLGEMERKLINNSAAAVMGSKISFEHASHLAGNSGILGVRRPYLIINRPDMCNPEKYGKYNGRPCMMHLYLGNLTGYTEIQEIQLTGFSATNPELAEISKMLKGGVIF